MYYKMDDYLSSAEKEAIQCSVLIGMIPKERISLLTSKLEELLLTCHSNLDTFNPPIPLWTIEATDILDDYKILCEKSIQLNTIENDLKENLIDSAHKDEKISELELEIRLLKCKFEFENDKVQCVNYNYRKTDF